MALGEENRATEATLTSRANALILVKNIFMDAATKFKMVEKIITTEDDVLLTEVKSLLGLDDRDFWDELSEETKASIQRGLEESKRGDTRPHDEVMTEIKARFLKA